MDKFKAFFVLSLWSLSSIQNVHGMFEAVLTQGDAILPNNDKWNLDNLKVKRFNRTAYVVTGTFDILIDNAGDCDLICILYKKAGNDYKLMPYKFGPKKLCQFVMEEELFYPAFHGHTKNFPALGTCDFKKGTYEINNYLPDLSKVPPVFESGDYMVECQAKAAGEIVNGYKVFAQIFNYANAKPGMPKKAPGIP